MNLPGWWRWKPAPDCDRLVRVLRREASLGRIPFLEFFADPEVIACLTGEPAVVPEQRQVDRRVLETCLHQKVDFWYGLGYDAFGQGPFIHWPGVVQHETEDTAGDLKHTSRKWVDEGWRYNENMRAG